MQCQGLWYSVGTLPSVLLNQPNTSKLPLHYFQRIELIPFCMNSFGRSLVLRKQARHVNKFELTWRRLHVCSLVLLSTTIVTFLANNQYVQHTLNKYMYTVCNVLGHERIGLSLVHGTNLVILHCIALDFSHSLVQCHYLTKQSTAPNSSHCSPTCQ